MAFSNQTPYTVIEKSKKALFSIKKDGTYKEIESRYKIFICLLLTSEVIKISASNEKNLGEYITNGQNN